MNSKLIIGAHGPLALMALVTAILLLASAGAAAAQVPALRRAAKWNIGLAIASQGTLVSSQR